MPECQSGGCAPQGGIRRFCVDLASVVLGADARDRAGEGEAGWMWIVLLVLAIFAALIVAGRRRMLAHRYIDAYVFDASVGKRLREKHPGLTPEQHEQVREGLRDFLHICRQARLKGVSMPSQAVDELWHDFILSTRHYREFCRRAFGRYLHHHPAETMNSPTQATKGIRRAWQLACRREKIDPEKPDRLPRLFALDAKLGIAGGFVYTLNCMGMGAQAGNAYCAGHIGCSSGCSAGCSGGCSSGDGGCGGGD